MTVDLSKQECASCKHARSKLRDGADVPEGKLQCRAEPPRIQLIPLVGVAVMPFALGVDKLGPDAPKDLAKAVEGLKGKPVFFPVTVQSPVVDPDYGCGAWAPRIMRGMH